jgi:prevent-host-death family protein
MTTTRSHIETGNETASTSKRQGDALPIIDAAQHGEPTTVTKHGRPAAMIVPCESGPASGANCD